MTGMPAEQYNTSEYWDYEVYELIKGFDDSGYIMTGVCGADLNGISGGHVYSILGVDDDTGMIRLRNPWSTEGYHGPGGDQANDGKFNMPLDDFL